MLEKFLTYISQKTLFSRQNRILLAISGGIDSMAMAHLFFKAQFDFAIAHCHFSLRPEADQEAELVSQLAQNFDVPFFFKKFDTITFAQNEKISVQMAARKLRYDFFEQICLKNEYDYIATAHHLNDSLETAIFNFAKGTGIAGLRGILPKNNRIVRPLLFATRSEIENYAKENQIVWLEDSSNVSEKYQRNFIRHQIVPRLATQINPNVVENFAETAERLIFTEKVLSNYLSELKSKIWQEKGGLFWLNAEKNLEATLLHYFLEPLGFSFRQCQQIQTCEQIGADFFSVTHWAVTDRHQLVITPIAFQEDIWEEWKIETHTQLLQSNFFSISISCLDTHSENFAPPSEALYFDIEKLSFPLRVRTWREGDTFQPLGMKGRKKISDFLVDEKVPKNLKKRVFVLISANEIAGILGMRSSEKFRVNAQTQKVLKIEVCNSTRQ
jgi:tRNA(Ile)-lysidine synthase